MCSEGPCANRVFTDASVVRKKGPSTEWGVPATAELPSFPGRELDESREQFDDAHRCDAENRTDWVNSNSEGSPHKCVANAHKRREHARRSTCTKAMRWRNNMGTKDGSIIATIITTHMVG